MYTKLRLGTNIFFSVAIIVGEKKKRGAKEKNGNGRKKVKCRRI